MKCPRRSTYVLMPQKIERGPFWRSCQVHIDFFVAYAMIQVGNPVLIDTESDPGNVCDYNDEGIRAWTGA